MDIEEFRAFCLSKRGVTEDMPFDDVVLVFKVMGKMFALTNVDTFESVNLKCDPEKAVELRQTYESVQEGYHMNKKHWNTIIINGELSDKELKHWINHSYELVVAKLPKKVRLELEKLQFLESD